jgi:hypothetical protein
MMKTNSILSILCVLLFYGSLSGKSEVSSVFKNQGLFTDTTDMSAYTTWSRTDWYLGGTKPVIIKIFVDRDTVIDNRLCRILKTKFDEELIEESDLPVFYKDKKMYFHEDGQWWILYDFKARQGDTVSFYLSKKTELYVFGRTGIPPLENNPYSIIIENIDTVFTTDGRPLQRFTTSHPIFGQTNVYGMYEIIEDIGSLFGLFGHFYIFTAEDWRYRFLCYKNESYIYPDDNSCSLTTSFDVSNLNILLSPNPVTNILLVTLGEYIPQNGIIHIHDATGRIVLSQRLYYGHNNIDMSSLQSGLYFWTAEDAGVKLKSGKIVKS